MPLNKIAQGTNISGLAYIEGPGRNHPQLIVPFHRCPKYRLYIFSILNHSLTSNLVVFVRKTTQSNLYAPNDITRIMQISNESSM